MMSELELVIFLFAGIGVINGLVVALYLFIRRTTSTSQVLFGALIFALCVRIGKSIAFYLYNDLSKTWLQIGLSFCVFIGPLLWAYTKASLDTSILWINKLIYQLTGLLLLVLIIGIWLPYERYPALWNDTIVGVIYILWMGYVLLTWRILRSVWRDALKGEPIDKLGKWLLWVCGVTTGITLLYQAAYFLHWPTYIWGAMAFTGFFYLLLIQMLSQGQNLVLLSKPRSQLSQQEKEKLTEIKERIIKDKSYRNPKLKLAELAQDHKVAAHDLSKWLNTENDGFATFINQLRVEEAQRLIQQDQPYSIEGIGYESGFNSKSSFYAVFKKITGMSPAQYRKSIE